MFHLTSTHVIAVLIILGIGYLAIPSTYEGMGGIAKTLALVTLPKPVPSQPASAKSVSAKPVSAKPVSAKPVNFSNQ